MRLKSLGVSRLGSFKTITKPPSKNLARSLENLYWLKVLDDQGNLTEMGRKAAELPIDVRLAMAILSNAERKFNCTDELVKVASLLSVQGLFYQIKDSVYIGKAKQKYGVIEGDHLSLLNLRREYAKNRQKSSMCKEIHINETVMKSTWNVEKNIKVYLKKFNLKGLSALDTDGEDIRKALLAGYFLNVAQKNSDTSYRTLRYNIVVWMHPSSVLYRILPEFVVYTQLIVTDRSYMLECSEIKKEWINEVAAHFYSDYSKDVIEQRYKNEVMGKKTGEKTEAGKLVEEVKLKFGGKLDSFRQITEEKTKEVVIRELTVEEKMLEDDMEAAALLRRKKKRNN